MSNQGQLRNLKMLLFFFHFTNTIIISFLPIYLDFKGLSGTEIGWVLAIGPLASIISQLFWGFLSDKYRTVKWVLIMTFIGMLIFIINDFIFIFILCVLCCFFYKPVDAFRDSLAQRQVDLLFISFGSIRTWGFISFVLSSLVIGLFHIIFGVEFMRLPYLLFGTLL